MILRSCTNGRDLCVENSGYAVNEMKMPRTRNSRYQTSYHRLERISTTTSRLPVLFLFIILPMLISSSAAAPLREEIPSNDTPLSIQDGFIPYSIKNSTVSKDLAKNTFYRLVAMEDEPPKLGGVGPPFMITEKPRRKNSRKKDRRKDIMNGRAQAIQLLGDTDALHREQTCEGQKFKQRVKVPGCLTKTIVNRFCHGTCASFFIPRMNSKKLKAYFKSCAACGPKEYDTVEVTLDCPGQDPPQVTRTVIKVKKCECINVDLTNS